MGQMVTFKRPDGKDCNGYLASPAGSDKAPGVVVIQEWWGLNDQIKGVAERLAALGYRALVPDLYKGKLALDAAEAKHMMTNLNFADAATQDVRGGVSISQAIQRESRRGRFLHGRSVDRAGGALCERSKRVLFMVWFSTRASRRRQDHHRTASTSSSGEGRFL